MKTIMFRSLYRTNSLCFSFSTTSLCGQSKILPKNMKNIKKSSQDWLTRHLNDPYVKLAQLNRYRARSAYKLLEINSQFKILKPGLTVIECGAAPGAWTQVIVPAIKSNYSDSMVGRVIAVDILHFSPVEGSIPIIGDFRCPKTTELILKSLEGRMIDLVVSDMAPNASGNKALDHECIMELSNSALLFTISNSQVGSSFLCKIWEGHRSKAFKSDLEKYFQSIKIVKPPASRSDSRELYLLGMNMVKELT